MKKKLSRAQGALLGLACGDALGATLEFRPKNEGNTHTEIIGAGPFHLAAGEWTDDTAMALCLARSLIDTHSFNPKDQLDRYLQWRHFGYQACQGHCFDIGATVSRALNNFEKHQTSWSPYDHESYSGNGGIMRLAPAVLAAKSRSSAVKMGIDSSRTTHSSLVCQDAAELLSRVLWELYHGKDLKLLLKNLPKMTYRTRALEGFWVGEHEYSLRDDIPNTGYAVRTLLAAFWSCYHATSFEEALINAVNLGGDADTIGAVTGQIAGMYWGVENIPQRWLDVLEWKDYLAETAEDLTHLQIEYGQQPSQRLWEVEEKFHDGEALFLAICPEGGLAMLGFTMLRIKTGRSRTFKTYRVVATAGDEKWQGEHPHSIQMALKECANQVAAQGYKFHINGIDERFAESGLSHNTGWGYLEGVDGRVHMLEQYMEKNE